MTTMTQILKISHCFICDERNATLNEDGWMSHINKLYQEAERVVQLDWEDCKMCRPLVSQEKTMCRVHINWDGREKLPS